MSCLDRQNRKNEKMTNGNQKSKHFKKHKKYQISDSMFSKGKTHVFPEEKEWQKKNNGKRI